MFSTTVFIRRHRNWCLFSIMATASLISCFQQVALATVAGDVAAALNVDAADLGLLSAAFFYPYALMQIPAGLLSDTLGPRKSVTIALILATLGTIIFAQAASLGTAIAARAIMGMGLAFIVVPMLKLFAVWFPISAFSRLTAIAFAISSLGPLMATSPMALAAATIGWRAPFYFLAAVSLLSAFLIWKIVRDHPDRIEELINTPGSGQGTANITMREASVPSGTQLRHKLGCILSNRDVWLLGIWYCFLGGIYYAFVGLWAGQYLTYGLGLPNTESGLILMLAACSQIFCPLFSWLSERIGYPRRMMFWLSLSSVLLLIPLVIGLPHLTHMLLVLYFLAISIAVICGAAVVFGSAKEHFDTNMAGTVSGFINMFLFIGGALLQQVMGLFVNYMRHQGLDEHTAITRSFSILLISALISLAAIWKYREASERATRTPGNSAK